ANRTLRNRNPIQLHPYMLELEKYRRTWKARGLRPVKVGHGHSKEHHEGHEPESQDQEFVGSQQLSSQPPSSPPLAPVSTQNAYSPPKSRDVSTREENVAVSRAPMDDDDEFPDVSTILARRLEGSASGGFKRRKTYASSTRKGKLPARKPAQDASSQSRTREGDDVFELPISPPHSYDSPQPAQSSKRAPKFRFPPGYAPKQPPTPLLSSESRSKTSIEHGAESESDGDSPPRSTLRHRRTVPTAYVISSASSSSDSESDPEPSAAVELQHAKKRIKGVLPASWLRLDQKAQEKRESISKAIHRRTISVSSHDTDHETTVGRGIRMPAAASINDANAINIDEESGPSLDAPSLNRQPLSRGRESGTGAQRYNEDDQWQDSMDVIEHNWVDAMLPSGNGKRSTKSLKKKRQTKLTDAVREPLPKRRRLDEPALPIRSSVHNRGHSGAQKSRHPGPSRQPRVPRLSILDAPSPDAGGSSRLPQFLRLAKRQARLRPDGGRHSPAKKHIRLQTAADTEDANGVLRRWRTGAIKSKTHGGLQTSLSVPKTRTDHDQRYLPPSAHSGISPAKAESLSSRRHTLEFESRLNKKRQTKFKPTRMTLALTDATRMHTDAESEHSIRPRRSRQQLNQKHIYRTAQLEGLEEDFDNQHRAVAFRRKLSKIDRTFTTRLQNTNAASTNLSRFLEDEDATVPLPVANATAATDASKVARTIERIGDARKKKQKHRPRRLDVETREFRQPSDPLPVEPLPLTVEEASSDDKAFLDGLGPYETRYTTDFDVFPLHVDTFFHESTFIGSGDLQRCLQIAKRDMDNASAPYHFNCDGVSYIWEFWTDDVASQMSAIFTSSFDRSGNWDASPQGTLSKGQVTASLADVCKNLRTISRYFSQRLCFLDPIDRRSFVSTTLGLLESVPHSVLLAEALPETGACSAANRPFEVRIILILAVLAFEILCVAKHPSVDEALERQSACLLKMFSQATVRLILRFCMKDLQNYLDDNRRHAQRELGLRDDKASVEGVVAISCILSSAGLDGCSFWDLVAEELTPRIKKASCVQSLESIWYSIFTMLPYQEFDATGILRVGRRFASCQENWSAVNAILSRVFELYPETLHRHSPSLNEYFRANFTRCFRLIRDWSWRRCNSVIANIFDFFARRGLSQLDHEESSGSPRFLEKLDQNPSLEILPEDRTFHIFLKMLVVGFKGLCHVYPDKKIGNIAWRLIPNHGRLHRRDEAIERDDLDALRNHHDLLCTLYWASPPGARPRLNLIQNLVDHTCSHREACRLSVRAWSNLVKYQISTNEELSALEPFAVWLKDMIETNIAQHRHARMELENQFETARLQGNESIAPENLQLLIDKNQSQILATLRDAVSGLKGAVMVANDLTGATNLLRSSSIVELFKLFDPKRPQVNVVIVEALEILDGLMKKHRRQTKTTASTQANDESQDYGVWPDSQEDETSAASTGTGNRDIFDFLHDPVRHLLSNCFGADIPPNDKLLTQVVDTWTLVAMNNVEQKKTEWGDYLNSYNWISWQQLRDTEQTRKYTPYFWAAVLEQDKGSFKHHHHDFIKTWLFFLVERTSMLKFQHRLTSSLLNANIEERLLHNLPFIVSPRTQKVEIALEEFRERRLGLISTVLASMRQDFENTMRMATDSLATLRSTYTDLLRVMMSAMKKNYLELRQGSEAKGSYVDFVQKVVEFLQQYTQDICPVDKFFTESSAFPLPVTDKTYVKGKLKNYANKLSETATVKKLAVFVQTVSERAAIDNEQAYLVGQFRSATYGTFEWGTRHTLRQVLLQAIFPAYMELALSTGSGWVMAKPILHASALILEDLALNFSPTDEDSVTTVESIVVTILDVLYRTVELLITHSGLLDQAHILHMLSLMFHTVRSTVVIVESI
ncbi:hypothetical protein K490DRAFT_17109, partial [Saccharata proteae CBS 121410]